MIDLKEKTLRLKKLFVGSAAAIFTSGILIACAGLSSPASDVAMPTVEGPVTGGERGYPYAASIVDLEPYGYTENEYFVSGRAHPYEPAPGTKLADDGRWQVVAGEDVPYKTRMLVRKPPAERFNGTVVVEFMQEYFGSERDTNYRWVAETLLREGFGWVGVSLHHEGIDDTSPQQTFNYEGTEFTTGMNLARWDPERYGTLSVPSSDLSYDILSQVGRAVATQSGSGVDPFADLHVRKVLAVGNTIAAKRLGIYINAVQPVAEVFDGFYLQDWTPGEVGLSQTGLVPEGYHLRTDVEVPVIVLNTTTAAVQIEKQAEGPKLRFWTPAGSSHTTGPYMVRVAKANKRDMDQTGGFCPPDYANNFPLRYIVGAAMVALDEWVKTGESIPSFPQLERVRKGEEWVTPFDEVGNSMGGLRTPWVDVPYRRYDWRGECPGGSGRSEALSDAKLRALYGTPAEFYRLFEKATRKAVEKGVLLPEDAENAIEKARTIQW